MYPLTVGLAVEIRELWEEVQASIQDLPVRVVLDQQINDQWGDFIEKCERLRPDAVLLDISRLRLPLEQVVAQFKSTSVDPMIVAMNVSADPDSILQALRAGVNEYLYPPLGANLRKALERRSSEQHNRKVATGRSGKVAAFVSVKGGCGATTVACHMAAELGKALGHDVLLADFDLEGGSVGFLMKSGTQYSVMDAVNNLHRLDTSYFKALVSNGHPGLEVIPAPPLSTRGEAPRQEHLRHVLSFLRSQYQWTVVDLGRGLNRASLSVLEDVDEPFLVTTLEVPALHRAKQVVQTLVEGGFPRNRLRLLLNRMPKRTEIMPEDLEKMLGVTVYGTLPDEYAELYECYSDGRLLPASSQLGRHFNKLAGKLTGATVEEKKKKFALFSF